MPPNRTILLEARKEGELVNTFAISACDPITVDGDTVYRCKIASRYQAADRSQGKLVEMAEYYDEEPIELTYAANFSTENLGLICLQMLCSSGGFGVTSTEYDVLSHGGELTDKEDAEAGADVDIASFLSMSNPIHGARFKPVWKNGQSIYEVLSGIMRAAGYVMDIRTNKDRKSVV